MTTTIYDLGGNVEATLEADNVPVGTGSVKWDENLPAADGIYTYRIVANHQDMTPPLGPCEDQDKSGVLTVTVNNFYWCEQDPAGGTLTGVVKYALNQDAWPGSVTIRFFGPDLEELDHPLTDQPHLAGAHFSDVYQIDAEFDQNGDPIGPIYCVIYANECEDSALLNRDGVAKPALQKGTTDLVRALEILEPNNDPVTDNNLVFNSTADPNGACAVTASGTTHGVFQQTNLEWDLDAIQGSTQTSNPDPPKGQNIAFTFTRLPSSNSEFGDNTLTLSHPSIPCDDTQTVQIFFARDATNHPGAGTGVTPNWYYYWDQTSASYGAHTYRGAAGAGQTVPGQQAGTFVSYIDAAACLHHPGGITGWGNAEGIDYFAWICRHEAKHLADLSGWWPNGWQAAQDTDTQNVPPGTQGDWIPTAAEPTCLPGHPYDPNNAMSQVDTFNYSTAYLILDIEHYCLSTQAQWTNGTADNQDWASPGHQSQL